MKTWLVAWVLALAACSSVSAVSVCKKGCQKTVRCTGGTTDQIATCEAACTSDDALATQLKDCTNASSILSCYDGCYGITDCNDSATCVSGCPKCVLSSGPGDGGSGDMPGAHDLSPSASCATFCTEANTCGLLGDMGNQCEAVFCPQVDAGPCQATLSCELACGDVTTSCQDFFSCVLACPQCTSM